MLTRTCKACQIIKPLDDFYKDQRYSKSGGYTRLCKSCIQHRNFPRLDKEPEGKSYAERLKEREARPILKIHYNKQYAQN